MDTGKMNSLIGEIKHILYKYTKEFNLNYDIILQQVKVESNFNPKQVSKSNQIGLFQLKKETFEDIKNRIQPIYKVKIQDNIYDIENNVKQGCLYMRWLLDNFGVYYYALMQYNSGYGTVKDIQNWRETNKTLSGETVEYIYKIFKEANVCQHL